MSKIQTNKYCNVNKQRTNVQISRELMTNSSRRLLWIKNFNANRFEYRKFIKIPYETIEQKSLFIVLKPSYLFKIQSYRHVFVVFSSGKGWTLPPFSRTRVQYVANIMFLAWIRTPGIANRASRRFGRFAKCFWPFFTASCVDEDVSLCGHIECRWEEAAIF